MICTAAFALIWIPQAIRGRVRGVAQLGVRILPLLATLSAAGLAALAGRSMTGMDVILRLGSVTPWSLGIFLLTLALPLFSVAGIVHALGSRHANIHRLVWWHALVTSVMLTILAGYLGHWGILGLRTWI